MKKTVALCILFALSLISLPVHANKLQGDPGAVSRLKFFENKQDFSEGEFHNVKFDPSRGLILERVDRDYLTSGTYISPVTKAPFPMTELLPSWNVEVYNFTGFAVYLKVSRKGDDWSPWLFLGRGGRTPALNDRRLRWNDAVVDVDYVLFNELHEYFQWKVVLYRSVVDDTPALSLFTACMGNSSGNKKIFERFGKEKKMVEGWKKRLDVPYRSQLSDEVNPAVREAVCCPVSVAMVLEYYGLNLPTMQVCDLCFDKIYEIWGVWPRASQTLGEFGLRSYITQIRNFSEIKDFISRDIPLIISIRAKKGEINSAPYNSAPGHLLVITGLDENEDVWVNDPYNVDNKTGPRLYKKEEIQKVLINKGGVAIVSEKPAD